MRMQIKEIMVKTSIFVFKMLKFQIWKAKKFTFLFSLQYMLSSLYNCIAAILIVIVIAINTIMGG